MKKAKFYFNPVDLTYVHHRPGRLQRILLLAGVGASFLLSMILVYSIYIYQQRTPAEVKLQQEVALYKRQVNQLNNRYEKINGLLSDLEHKDNDLYRAVFEADPLPSTVTGAGMGGSVSLNSEDAIHPDVGLANHKLSELSGRLNVLTQSYSEMLKLAKQKTKFLASMPAIQPVSNKNLYEIASGFGMRIHPIYKTPKMHEGLDFAAAKGTDVYATGDGVVETVDFDGSGYGNYIKLSHGFGYMTVYGHLSKVLVKEGQKIKRGELIGLVGSTGLSTAPHLHYEVVKNGNKVNPVHYFHNDLSVRDYEKVVNLANRANQSFD